MKFEIWSNNFLFDIREIMDVDGVPLGRAITQDIRNIHRVQIIG